jgi:hypothetical protein
MEVWHHVSLHERLETESIEEVWGRAVSRCLHVPAGRRPGGGRILIVGPRDVPCLRHAWGCSNNAEGLNQLNSLRQRKKNIYQNKLAT